MFSFRQSLSRVQRDVDLQNVIVRDHGRIFSRAALPADTPEEYDNRFIGLLTSAQPLQEFLETTPAINSPVEFVFPKDIPVNPHVQLEKIITIPDLLSLISPTQQTITPEKLPTIL